MKKIKPLVPFNSLHLVATNPDEMAGAQQSMIHWCAKKMAELTNERTDAVENRDAAKRNKWRSEPWQRRVRQIQHQMTFYQKVKAALEAGYYMLPPLPVDVFAIRTDRKHPTPRHTSTDYPSHRQSPRLLPPGEGRYVSPDPTIWSYQQNYESKGETKVKTIRYAKAYQMVDFPVVAVRPEIMEATNAAMKKKIFDRLGLIAPESSRGRDPMIAGEILRPHGNRGYYERPVTFFIGWWLNLEDL